MGSDAGQLPKWGMAELPSPLPFNLKNAWKLVGPGTIAVGVSIGSGEWLLGPAVTVKYGAALLWVATVSIIGQTILNQEMIRYTLATGEPIFTGILRTWPGPWFWGPIYSLLFFLQVGWPSWALFAAIAITALFKGSIPTATDKSALVMCGYITLVVSILIVVFGNKIEKTMEYLETFMVIWILVFLLVTALFFTSFSVWGKIWSGFFGLGVAPIPKGGDWVLLGSFAAWAGMGGISNGVITSWVRDKGWGMANTVGYIPALIGRHETKLSHIGNVFPLTKGNIKRFHAWMTYVKFEQYVVFAGGCFLGVALPAIVTVHFVPSGTDITKDWGGPVYQARGIASVFGPFAWILTLLTGFWIMFSTQLGIVEMFARTITDISWAASSRLRSLVGRDVRKVYYSVLILYALFGAWAINQAQPFTLVAIAGFITCVNFVVLGMQTILVQWKFLPPQLRMPLWRLLVIVALIVMFSFFSYMTMRQHW